MGKSSEREETFNNPIYKLTADEIMERSWDWDAENLSHGKEMLFVESGENTFDLELSVYSNNLDLNVYKQKTHFKVILVIKTITE